MDEWERAVMDLIVVTNELQERVTALERPGFVYRSKGIPTGYIESEPIASGYDDSLSWPTCGKRTVRF